MTKNAAPEMALPLKTRCAESLARLFDAPATGHGFRGYRIANGPQIFRVDWSERQQLAPIFPNGALDFGPSAKWDDARQLSHLLLCAHFDRFFGRRDWRGEPEPTRHVQKCLRDGFTRQIVRTLPDDWQLPDIALHAWIFGVEARRMEFFGAAICREAYEMKFLRRVPPAK